MRHETTAVDRLQAVAFTVAGNAPSIINPQPWLWRVPPEQLGLFVTRGRQLTAGDPQPPADAQLRALLHHARIALTAEGWPAHVPGSRKQAILTCCHAHSARPDSGGDGGAAPGARDRHPAHRPAAVSERSIPAVGCGRRGGGLRGRRLAPPLLPTTFRTGFRGRQARRGGSRQPADRRGADVLDRPCPAVGRWTPRQCAAPQAAPPCPAATLAGRGHCRSAAGMTRTAVYLCLVRAGRCLLCDPVPFVQAVQAGCIAAVCDHQIRYEVFGSEQWCWTSKRATVQLATTA
jgi:hypothetical protein